MQFWKGNRTDAQFEMPAAEVAAKFTEWIKAQPGFGEAHSEGLITGSGLNLERLLRHWLTSPEHFNSVWEAESRAVFGPESFDGIYDTVWMSIFSKGHVGR